MYRAPRCVLAAGSHQTLTAPSTPYLEPFRVLARCSNTLTLRARADPGTRAHRRRYFVAHGIFRIGYAKTGKCASAHSRTIRVLYGLGTL